MSIPSGEFPDYSATEATRTPFDIVLPGDFTDAVLKQVAKTIELREAQDIANKQSALRAQEVKQAQLEEQLQKEQLQKSADLIIANHAQELAILLKERSVPRTFTIIEGDTPRFKSMDSRTRYNVWPLMYANVDKQPRNSTDWAFGSKYDRHYWQSFGVALRNDGKLLGWRRDDERRGDKAYDSKQPFNGRLVGEFPESRLSCAFKILPSSDNFNYYWTEWHPQLPPDGYPGRVQLGVPLDEQDYIKFWDNLLIQRGQELIIYNSTSK